MNNDKLSYQLAQYWVCNMGASAAHVAISGRGNDCRYDILGEYPAGATFRYQGAFCASGNVEQDVDDIICRTLEAELLSLGQLGAL